MLRFSANLGFLWSEQPLLERIERAADAGFGAIELHWPYDTPAGQVRAARERRGLKLLGLNTAVGDAAAGDFGLGAIPGREHEFAAAMEQAIAYCALSGATSIHVMAGKLPVELRPQGLAVFEQNLHQAAVLAEASGLTLLLEPINRNDQPLYSMSTLAEAAALIEAVGSARVRLMFDVYHVARQEGDVLTKLQRYREIIGHVQIAAVPSRAEPNIGEINYRSIFTALEAIGYEGYIGCEYKPSGTTDAGLSWISDLGQTLASR